MSVFCCPICAAPLERVGGSYRCPRGHSYDIAREGYVHLLPANRKHAKEPGDDRGMVAARGRFLEGGWYEHLCRTLRELALVCCAEETVFLDAGCGEGYYTAAMVQALSAAGKLKAAAGVDLSRAALKRAARRVREAEFAVASVYHMPVGDGAASLLLDCFAPLALEEYRRVLRPGGVFLYVVPAPEHLMEMKQILYETPYENPDQTVEYQGFRYLDVVPVSRRVALEGENILDLFRMTPYAWKTPREGMARLGERKTLEVTASFRVHVFRRL